MTQRTNAYVLPDLLSVDLGMRAAYSSAAKLDAYEDNKVRQGYDVLSRSHLKDCPRDLSGKPPAQRCAVRAEQDEASQTKGDKGDGG